MIRIATVALCAVLFILLALPVAAQDDTDWGVVETLPVDWPFPLYLPDYGELVMVGWEGYTREDVTEPFDFEWFYEAEEGSGDIYLIQGFFQADPEADNPEMWAAHSEAFVEELVAMGIEVNYVEPEAWYGGRRWTFYELSQPAAGDEPQVDLYTLVGFGDGGMSFLNFFCDMPANEDFDAMLSLIIGGPDAPQ